MHKLLGTTILAGMLAGAYAQSDVRGAARNQRTDQRAAARQTASDQVGKDEGGVQGAIRFERAKEAAAARQARIEARGEKSQKSVAASGRTTDRR